MVASAGGERSVLGDDALDLLERAATRISGARDLVEAAKGLIQLGLSTHGARSGFVARGEGAGALALRWVAGEDREGRLLEAVQHARALSRVEAALRESLAGVADAPPPEMTGGPAPQDAIAVKSEAGQPPIHCFALVEDDGRPTASVLGVLALYPDPSQGDRQASSSSQRALRIARELVRARLRSELDREQGHALLEAALGAPPDAPADDEAEPGGDPRGFRFRYDDLVTRSPKMFDLFKTLDRVIPLDVPVLIGGPTGTGKELVARAIHRNSPRRKRRFYAQNCGAISESLLESELFGYAKGAFTGADKYKKGLFEIASGSTLFLDEIGEMSLEMQKKLLRVLQEKEVVPLGSQTPVPVDVRIVCATHRDLSAEVASGRFREDLYYRLKVIRVDLPPLKDRPEDVPILVDHFLKKIARARGERAKVLDRRDPRIMKRLVDYAWPGNIRQLENVVTRLAHLSGEVVTWDVLAEDKQLAPEEPKPVAVETRAVRALDDVVEEVERAEIENALRQTKGNRTRAASLLKINRRSLLRRLKKYGLASEEDEAALAEGADEAAAT
jgi:DNA-binding NtrC family response regulator